MRRRTALAVVAGLALAASPACKNKNKDQSSDDGEAAAQPEPGDEGAAVGGQEPAETAPAAAMIEVDLAAAGIPATMQAPEGATVEESFGSARVVAPGFGVEISAGHSDLAELEAFWERNDANELEAWLLEEDDALLARTLLMGRTEHHLAVNVEGGESGYSCEDIKGESWTEAQAKVMVAACKSIAPADGKAESEE